MRFDDHPLKPWALTDMFTLADDIRPEDEVDDTLAFHVFAAKDCRTVYFMGSIDRAEIEQTVHYLRFNRKFPFVYVVKSKGNNLFGEVARSEATNIAADMKWTNIANLKSLSRGTRVTIEFNGRDYPVVIDSAVNWGDTKTLDPDWDIECHDEPSRFARRIKQKYDGEHGQKLVIRLGWQ